MEAGSEAEHKILSILQSHPDGIEDALLTVALKDLDEVAKVTSLNRLIERNRVVLFASARGTPVYKY